MIDSNVSLLIIYNSCQFQVFSYFQPQIKLRLASTKTLNLLLRLCLSFSTESTFFQPIDPVCSDSHPLNGSLSHRMTSSWSSRTCLSQSHAGGPDCLTVLHVSFGGTPDEQLQNLPWHSGQADRVAVAYIFLPGLLVDRCHIC